MADFLTDEQMNLLQAKEAPNSGLLSDEDMAKIKAEDDKYDRPIEAAAQGVARGLTFGLSDVAQTATGFRTGEELAKIKELSPTASTIGEVGGVIGGALAPIGPAGALIKGVTKAGQVAEGFVAKQLVDAAAKSTAKNILAKAGAKAAGSAVEGAFYGAGQVVSEAALGDPKVAAENALSTIGLSALLGGGFTGALAVAAPAIKVAAKSAGPTLSRLKDNLIGLEPETRKILTSIPAKVEALAEKGSSLDEVLLNHSNELISEAQAKNQVLVDSVKSNISNVLNEPKNFVRETPISKILTGLDEDIASLRKRGPALGPESENYGQQLVDTRRRLLNRARSYQNIPDGVDVAISDLKVSARDLHEITQDLQAEARLAYQKAPMGKMSDVEAIYKNTARESRKVLGTVDERILKENARLSAALSAEDELRKRGIMPLGDFDANKFKKIFSDNEGAFQEYLPALKSLDEAWGMDLSEQVLAARAFKKIYPKDMVSSFQTGRSLLNPFLGGLAGTALGPVGTLGGAIAGVAISSPAAAKYKAQLANAVESILSKSSGAAEKFGAASKYIPHELVPFAAAKVAAMANLERNNRKVDKSIQSALNNFIDNDGESSEPDSLSALQNMKFGKTRRDSSEDRLRAFEKRIEELNKLIVNPEVMTDLIAKNLGQLSLVAPQISNELAGQATNAAMFLYSKAPKPTDLNPLNLKNDWTPSDAALAKWERYVSAVNDPMSVLSDIKQKRVTAEQIEALKVIYPSFYQKLVAQAAEKLQDKKVPYNDRLQLSRMLGFPADRSMKPKSFMMLQSQFQQPGAGATPVAGSKNLSFSVSRETNQQRIEGR